MDTQSHQRLLLGYCEKQTCQLGFLTLGFGHTCLTLEPRVLQRRAEVISTCIVYFIFCFNDNYFPFCVASTFPVVCFESYLFGTGIDGIF